MLHYMHLHPKPFEQVANGTKTIEIRINDDKRRRLKVGDTIEFESRADPGRVVTAEIVALPTFKTFKEMFEAFPPTQYGGESADEYESMFEHYSKEEETLYGVVAIQFALR